MYIRSIASIVIVTSSFLLSFGQDAPVAPKVPEAPRVFSFGFDGGGTYLGVQTQEVNKDNFSRFGLREVRGVAVEKVMENSPAAAAGIQVGDVIVRFNGEEVTSARKLTRLVGEVDADHLAKVTVIRKGSEQELTATIAKRPMPKFAEGNFNFPPMGEWKDLPGLKDLPDFKGLPNGEPRVFSFPDGKGRAFTWRAGQGRSIGVGVIGLTKQLASHYGVEGGLLVTEVRDNSAASRASLAAGDIITEVDGKEVRSQIDLIKAINAKKEGPIQLTVVRKGTRQTMTVTPEASKDNGFVLETGERDDGE